LLDDLTSKQISEWEAFDRIEPIDSETRADYRNGILASLVANLASQIYKKKGEKPKEFSPKDFMPDYEDGDKTTKESKSQSVEEQKRILMGLAGKDNTKNG